MATAPPSDQPARDDPIRVDIRASQQIVVSRVGRGVATRFAGLAPAHAVADVVGDHHVQRRAAGSPSKSSTAVAEAHRVAVEVQDRRLRSASGGACRRATSAGPKRRDDPVALRGRERDQLAPWPWRGRWPPDRPVSRRRGRSGASARRRARRSTRKISSTTADEHGHRASGGFRPRDGTAGYPAFHRRLSLERQD